MTAKIESSALSGKLKAIPSKSYAHRIAICNFLSGGKVTANCDGFYSNDIFVTEDCLKKIKAGERVLDAGESGSTLRFLLPLCSALGGEFTFIGHGKLLDRPNEELFAVLREHAIKIEKDKTINISGKLTCGKFFIRGDISSQYISGLLMALPILDGDSEIVLTTPLQSAPYVDITLQVLESFGIEIQKRENGFFVKGNQKFCGGVLPEGDWSNMAFFLCAGAIGGDITVTGLNTESVQGDRCILDILELAGAKMYIEKDSVRVVKSELKPFSYSAKDCPDLVPITAVLASFTGGTCQIHDIERLKIKESDRIESTITMLNAFGVKAQSDGKSLTIYPSRLNAGKIDSFNDHRIAMSSAVLASFVFGSSIIERANAVNKSYPNFFEHLSLVGGKVSGI